MQYFNGIRVICSTAIIFFHIFIYEFFTAVTNRVVQYQYFTGLYIYCMLLLSQSVDIFYFLAGFLVSYLTIQELYKKKESFSWTVFIIRRYIRYIPSYYFVLVIDLVLLKHMTKGPQWPLIEQISPFCKDYWWRNFLFIQNIIPLHDVPCNVWTWLVAADFQFF